LILSLFINTVSIIQVILSSNNMGRGTLLLTGSDLGGIHNPFQGTILALAWRD
jgi:hypothetical protein